MGSIADSLTMSQKSRSICWIDLHGTWTFTYSTLRQCGALTKKKNTTGKRVYLLTTGKTTVANPICTTTKTISAPLGIQQTKYLNTKKPVQMQFSAPVATGGKSSSIIHLTTSGSSAPQLAAKMRTVQSFTKSKSGESFIPALLVCLVAEPLISQPVFT